MKVESNENENYNIKLKISILKLKKNWEKSLFFALTVFVFA